MSHTWQLQDAKNKLSEVIEDALKQGPQIITRRGIETAVVLSFADYRKMLLTKKRLSQFFQDSPLTEEGLDLARDTSTLRDESVVRDL